MSALSLISIGFPFVSVRPICRHDTHVVAVDVPEIVDQAEAGVEVELTRRGQPVAVVVSRRTFDRLREQRGQFNDAYQRFLDQFSLDEIGLEPDEPSATRDTTTGRRVTL